jgi:uncharacterized protein YaaN involved in tellurite resistance
MKPKKPLTIAPDTLKEEFESLVAEMQTSKARTAARSISKVTPEELRKAAAQARTLKPY